MRNKIKPSIILTLDIQNYYGIPMVVTTSTNDILAITKIMKGGTHYRIRQQVMEFVDLFLQKYNIDTILMEQNKLFIDKIDRHPDPFVLSNITLGYGIKISLQDRYYNKIHYILELPQKEWTDKVLNRTTKYSIDLYKSHIALRDLTQDYMNIIEQNHCYKALCLSESVSFDVLMNKKYWINKE